MIHSVIAGNAGSLHNLENELAEIKKDARGILRLARCCNKYDKKTTKILYEKKNKCLFNCRRSN